MRVAMFAVAALAACGRIGFDGQLARSDAGETVIPDGPATDTSGSGDDAPPGEGSFGTMTVGISSQNTGPDRIWITRFMLTEPAQLTRLVAHFGGSGGQGAMLRGVVYADASGTATTLLGTTDETSIAASAPADWVQLPFAAPVALAPGPYWLGIHNASSVSIQYQSSVGATKFASDLYSDGTAATYGGNMNAFTMELSIYAEYTR